MSLRDKYAFAIQTCKGMFQGNATEENGKLHFAGSVATEEQRNKIWDVIKTIPDWQSDIVADIEVTGGPAAAAAPKTYTVKAGDTLGGIAKEVLGGAGSYMKIFDLNKDQLTDPNVIKPGQVLRLP